MDDCTEHPYATEDHYYPDIAAAELMDAYALAGFLSPDGHEYGHHPMVSSEETLGPDGPVCDDLEIVDERVPSDNESKATKLVARISFRTKSEKDVMEDGYRWRKYGKKSVKTSPHPRNYYKCMSVGCKVKKRVERDRDDSSYVITTYEGVHDHESQPP